MECPCATAPAASAAAQMSFDSCIAARLLDDLSLGDLKSRNGFEVSSDSKEKNKNKIEDGVKHTGLIESNQHMRNFRKNRI